MYKETQLSVVSCRNEETDDELGDSYQITIAKNVSTDYEANDSQGDSING